MLSVLIAGAVTAAVALAGGFSLLSPSTLLGCVVALFALAGVWFSAKAYAQQKTGEVWEHSAAGWQVEAAAQKERAERWEQDSKEERELKHTALSELAAARMKTDMTVVMKQMAEQHEVVMKNRADQHNAVMKNLADQHAAVMENLGTTARTLSLIEERLQRVEKIVHFHHGDPSAAA